MAGRRKRSRRWPTACSRAIALLLSQSTALNTLRRQHFAPSRTNRPMPWLDWCNSLAKPNWTPAPSTIGLIWQILLPDLRRHVRLRVRAGEPMTNPEFHPARPTSRIFCVLFRLAPSVCSEAADAQPRRTRMNRSRTMQTPSPETGNKASCCVPSGCCVPTTCCVPMVCCVPTGCCAPAGCCVPAGCCAPTQPKVD